MVESAVDHCAMLDEMGFENYCVSLKDSDSDKVIEANKRFAERRPDVPLHLGVTEAGLPPEGIIKTRIAFEQLVAAGIGDTIRVSLTLPDDDKGEEIVVGRQILKDIEEGLTGSLQRAAEAADFDQRACVRLTREALDKLHIAFRVANNFAHDDLVRRHGEANAAAAAAHILEIAKLAELMRRLDEMRVRYAIGLGDILNARELFAPQRAIHQCSQSVVRVSREPHLLPSASICTPSHRREGRALAF